MVVPGGIVWFMIGLLLDGSFANTRYLIKLNSNASDLFKTKHDNLRIVQDPIAITKSPLDPSNADFEKDQSQQVDSLKFEKRHSFVESSTFNPDVLNKFLEEYATKIKSTTEKNYKYPFTVVKQPIDSVTMETHDSTSELITTIDHESNNSTESGSSLTLNEDQLTGDLNDTWKRNKYWSNDHHDDRNGWVTLDAIPWSKSKISKWQANLSTQRPWPEMKPWEKPNGGKPYASDFPSRPTYEIEKPWYEKPKPHWSENAANDKPWYKPERPTSRPPYFDDNKFNVNPSQAQKWPPEMPSDSYKQTTDIITDHRPSNFPNSWDRPQISKPAYAYDRYSEINNGDDRNDWKIHNYNFPSKQAEMNGRPPYYPESNGFDRPNFSQYKYTTDHPPSHPSSGDGQWVLLSTNRGYSKSRQRSIKIDALNGEGIKIIEPSKKLTKADAPDPAIPVMTSKRQVRLTVLPSINGTNTTTSHGGLLEVEKTFKTVDQSQKEYEKQKDQTSFITRKPVRNNLVRQPTNSAVLAAVGAGMLPATMAMMIPMMLGRKRRSLGRLFTENSSQNSYTLDNVAFKVNNQRTKLLRM